MKIFFVFCKHFYFYHRRNKATPILTKYLLLFILVFPTYLFQRSMQNPELDSLSPWFIILGWLAIRIFWVESKTINLTPYLNLPIRRINLIVITQILSFLDTKNIIFLSFMYIYFQIIFNDSIFVMFLLFSMFLHLVSFIIEAQSIKIRLFIVITMGLISLLLTSKVNEFPTEVILDNSNTMIISVIGSIIITIIVITKFFNRLYLS
jgi:hypothetical protein